MSKKKEKAIIKADPKKDKSANFERPITAVPDDKAERPITAEPDEKAERPKDESAVDSKDGRDKGPASKKKA
jgi:hypothetical protein